MDDLDFRLAFVTAAIDALMDMDDPRKEDAIQHYLKQRSELEQKRAERDAVPHDVVIGLQSATLFAKRG